MPAAGAMRTLCADGLDVADEQSFTNVGSKAYPSWRYRECHNAERRLVAACKANHTIPLYTDLYTTQHGHDNHNLP